MVTKKVTGDNWVWPELGEPFLVVYLSAEQQRGGLGTRALGVAGSTRLSIILRKGQ